MRDKLLNTISQEPTCYPRTFPELWTCPDMTTIVVPESGIAAEIDVSKLSMPQVLCMDDGLGGGSKRLLQKNETN